MLLGDVLASFDDETIAAETILGFGDLTLIARLRQEADAAGLSLGAYAAGAVRRYAADAPDEEWVTLMGALGRADDPGAVCMQRAFAFVLGRAPAAERVHRERHAAHGA
jgi:hypothetical protein